MRLQLPVAQTIYKLHRVAQLLDPNRDFTWLAEIEKDLALVMRPKSRDHRLLTYRGLRLEVREKRTRAESASGSRCAFLFCKTRTSQKSVRQMMLRPPSPSLQPPARLPALGDDRLESLPSTIEEIRSALLDAFDRQHQIDAVMIFGDPAVEMLQYSASKVSPA
jgi:hypothetical protein